MCLHRSRSLPRSSLLRLLRSFTWFADSCRDLVADFAAAVTVLTLEYHPAVVRNRYDIDPVRIFQNVEFRIYDPVGQHYLVAAGSKPGPSYQVLAFQNTPFAYVLRGICLMSFRYFFHDVFMNR